MSKMRGPDAPWEMTEFENDVRVVAYGPLTGLTLLAGLLMVIDPDMMEMEHLAPRLEVSVEEATWIAQMAAKISE